MTINTRPPQVISKAPTQTKLFKTDRDKIAALVEDRMYDTASDAVRELVNEALRHRRTQALGRDKAMYAVAKELEMGVYEGTKPLMEQVAQIDRRIRDDLNRRNETMDETMKDLVKRIRHLEKQSTHHASKVNRLLEISVICYGILRHYVLGLFVIRLTKTKFEDYATGFKKRLEIFRWSMKSSNFLLDGEYERLAEEFARSLEEATSVTYPQSNRQQATAQKREPPVLTDKPFDVPEDFPWW
jgi:Arc/MetJ-type ribon-helix-helix transcriptional regulator